MGRPKGSKNKFHSSVTLNCGVCKKEFQVAAGRGETAKFCSQNCYSKMKTGNFLNTRNKKRVCRICGTHFIGTSNEAYCSRKCKRETTLAKNKPRMTRLCEQCGSPFTIMKWQRYKTLYCSRMCRLLVKPFGVYANGFRRAFKKRGWPIDRCQWCGYNEHPEILGFHHKDRNRKNNALENIALVCPNCHALEHGHFINHPV